MMSEELKPCPFCGGTPTLDDCRTIFAVRCDCGVCMLGERAPEPDNEMTNEYWYHFKMTAIDAWNQREAVSADELAALKAGQGEAAAAVAYLDVGAGGYVDLGTDQPIEALEKMPYGRHMLGIIGTYGADGWKPSPSQPATKSEPVGYAAFSDNGKIRVWSLEPGVIEMMAAQGCKAVPLYTAPPASADAVSVPRELLESLLERYDSHTLVRSTMSRVEELRALLARQEVKS